MYEHIKCSNYEFAGGYAMPIYRTVCTRSRVNKSSFMSLLSRAAVYRAPKYIASDN